jgi:DNA-binding MarR family transcriptional regulator
MGSKQLPYAALIKQLSTEIQKRADAALQESDLTMTQMYFLGALSHLPGGCATLKELERHFRVAQSTAAGVAARMEKKGLIESLPSEGDRRVKRVRITASGEETLRRALETMERGEQQMLAPLDDAEQETLLTLLRRVHSALRREEGDCPCP